MKVFGDPRAKAKVRRLIVGATEDAIMAVTFLAVGCLLGWVMHDRWAAHGRARVALPGRKAVVVPCASPFAAIQCAAELWGVPWQEVVNGARVMWAPPET